MENNGKGIFYGVIGVATLIVAIIGATFAYFTATDETTENIGGAAEKIGLSVGVEKVTFANDKTGLIPLQTENLDKALGGASSKNGVCVDEAGYTICHIYKVTVENTAAEGSAAITVAGTAEVNSVGENALVDLMLKPVTFSTDTYASTGTAAALANKATLVVNDNATIAPGDSATYYFVVYLNNNGLQDTQQGGTYTGKVVFNAGSGSELQATFTATQEPGA